VSFNLIRKQAFDRLKKNIFTAISIMFVVLVVRVCLILANHAFGMILKPDLFNTNFGLDLSLPSIIATLCSLSVIILIANPLKINVKKWFLEIRETKQPFNTAFSIFGTFKTYINSVWYGIIKMIVVMLTWFGLLIPTMIIAVALRVLLDRSPDVGILFASLFIIMTLFILLAIFYFINIGLGFFFSDFIFAKGIEKNPVKAIRLSIKIAKHKRVKMVLFFLSYSPYLLLCLLIIPIVFIIPYIKTAFAFFSDDMIMEYQRIQSEKADIKS